MKDLNLLAYFPCGIFFIAYLFLFFRWFKSRKDKDGKDKFITLIGFALGQVYLIYEVMLSKLYGKAPPQSPEQKMQMLRLLLGASPGGIFTIFGLFYISFITFGALKNQGDELREELSKED